MPDISAQTFLERIIGRWGEEYAPKGLVLQDPVTLDEWILSIQTTLLPKVKKMETYGRGVHGGIFLDSKLMLHFAEAKDKLWWRLVEDGTDVGAGMLSYHKVDHTYEEVYAALFFERLWGKRLYAKILRSLSHAVDAPIESSSQLKSAAAVRAWKHMGLFWPERNKFRLDNPRKRVLEWCPAFHATDLALFLTGQTT